MADRMHREDLRAFIAAKFLAGPLEVNDPGWNANARGSAIKEADALLAELERTAVPEPVLEIRNELARKGLCAWCGGETHPDTARCITCTAQDLEDVETAVARAEAAENRAACLEATLEENRKLKDLLEAWEARVKGLEAKLREERRLHGLTQDRLEALDVEARTYFTADGPVILETKEEVIHLRQEAARRLAGLDAAKAGEPPMPEVNAWGEVVDLDPLEAWGRQGWDAAAALRVERDRVQVETEDDSDCIRVRFKGSDWIVFVPDRYLAHAREQGREEGRKEVQP